MCLLVPRDILTEIEALLSHALLSALPDVFPLTSVTSVAFFAVLCENISSEPSQRDWERKLVDIGCKMFSIDKSASDIQEQLRWIFTGFSTMKLFAPPIVDPLQKARAKRDCLSYQVML